MEFEECGGAPGTDAQQVVVEDGLAAAVADELELLQDLRAGEGVVLDPAEYLGFEGVEFARAGRGPARLVAGAAQPLGDGVGGEAEAFGDLGLPEFFVVVEVVDLQVGLVVDHGGLVWGRSLVSVSVSQVSC